MRYKFRNLASAATGLALIALSGTTAHAAGTTAGTTITNTVSVDYKVGGVDQVQETDSNDVVVDRKINLTVARTDDTVTAVTPGQTDDTAVSFQVTNTSNATLDFQLTAAQLSGGTTDGLGTDLDAFDVTAPLTFYLDDGDGIFNAGDTLVTHLNALAPDTPVVVHVVADAVPNGLANSLISGVTLAATAREDDAAATLGAALTADAANTAGMDTIFADAAGEASGDGLRDATHSDVDAFEVNAATITATKSSTILSNTANFSTGTAVPGATIQYCIAVTNASGGADATALDLQDVLPSNVTYDAAYGVKVGGADCSTPGAASGAFSASPDTVSGTIATLASGTTQTLIFQATID